MAKSLELIKSKYIENTLKYTDIPMRENIPIEKGVSLTEPYLRSIQPLLEKYFDFFMCKTLFPKYDIRLFHPMSVPLSSSCLY